MFVSLTYSETEFVFSNKNILYFIVTLTTSTAHLLQHRHDASVTSSFSIFK